MFLNQNNKLIFETQNIEWMEGYIDFERKYHIIYMK